MRQSLNSWRMIDTCEHCFFMNFVLTHIIGAINSLICAGILPTRYLNVIFKRTLNHGSIKPSVIAFDVTVLLVSIPIVIMNVKCSILNLQHFILMFFNVILSVVFSMVHHCIFWVCDDKLIETYRFLLFPTSICITTVYEVRSFIIRWIVLL
jgi:hypothetical protein